jgi:hypothetical protein
MEEIQAQAQSIADDLALHEALPDNLEIRAYTLHDAVIVAVRVGYYAPDELQKILQNPKISAVDDDNVIQVFVLPVQGHEITLFLADLMFADVHYIDLRHIDLEDLVLLTAGLTQKPERLHLVADNRFYDDHKSWCDEQADKIEDALDEMDKDQFWRGDEQ